MDLQPYYDKILHITVTFFLLAFLLKFAPLDNAIVAVIALQIVKTIYNFSRDREYIPVGDWIANAAGYGAFFLYRWI